MTLPATKPNNTGSTRTDAYKHQRAKIVAEMALRGVPNKTIADFMNLSTRQIINIKNYAAEEGIVEEVRVMMQEKLLKKAADAYTEILDSPVEDVEENAKGYAVKRQAAKDLNQGLGVFRDKKVESTETHTLDLQQWLANQQIANEPHLTEIIEAKQLESGGAEAAPAEAATEDASADCEREGDACHDGE